MTELLIWIPDTLQAEPADPSELIVPTIPARNIRSGIIHPDRLPPSLANLEQVEGAIAQHVAEEDPHPQYAPDTHDHPTTSITGLTEAIDDRVGALLVPGVNVALDYDDTANTLTISAVAGGGSAGVASFNTRTGAVTLQESDIPATIARSAALADHIDDQGTGFHIPSGGITNSHVALGAAIDWAKIAKIGSQPADIGAAPAAHTHSPTNITGLDEAIDDRISALLVPGANITLNYNDSAGTLTISAAGSSGGGAANWGGIGGNLLNQLDLIAALNSKQDLLAFGNLSSSSSALSVSGGTGAIVGSGVTLSIAEATSTVSGLLTASDKAKLDGIATGATVNQPDTFLLNRANHTGTQSINTVDGLQAALDARQLASSQLAALAELAPDLNEFIVGNGTGFTTRTLTEQDIPPIPANRINSGLLAAERIPSLANLYQAASGRLSELVDGFAAAPLLASPRKNAAGTAIEWAVPAGGGSILLSSATLQSPASHTGNSNETALHTFLLPPGLLGAVGEHLEILMYFSNTGTGNKNYRLRLGSITGTVIHQLLNSGVSASMNRRLDYNTPTTGLTTPIGTTGPDFIGSGTPITFPLDWAAGQTIVCSVNLATASDVSTLRAFRVRIFK